MEEAARSDQPWPPPPGNALARQLRVPACVYPYVPRPRLSRVPEKLLIDERPRVQAWHEHLADIIATVMHEHG